MLKNIIKMNQVKKISFKRFGDDLSNIVVFESESAAVPFKIERVFTVSSPKNTTRGKHAHKKCTQLLVCANGSIKVTCDNGHEKNQVVLDKANIGLLIQPGVWAIQEYIEDNSILTVICDEKYSEEDYIRDYQSFLKFINI
jgi:dTDP-4-dehydrorhamnose 3,5-epimerase-like enzyme